MNLARDPETLWRFIVAGRARLKLVNARKNTEVKFIIQRSTKNLSLTFVRDPLGNYVGCFTKDKFFPPKEGETLESNTFSWFFTLLKERKTIPQNLEVLNDSVNCAYCGRPLKTAESKALGIGPECIKKVRIA